jgi:hypothetical protein
VALRGVDGEEWRGKGSKVGGRHLLKALDYVGQRGKKEGPYRRGRVETGEGGERGAGTAASSSWLAVGGSSSRARQRRVAEQGGRRGVGVTDKQGRVSQGPGVSGGEREGERRARQHDDRAPTCGPR